ncbi:hypothetical protein BS47DRAFT_1483908 [Hydnum rufescens UP504]|uniref:Uncharacterized protein n=1 Tax=Hydnum rufescens UP504 TaxID=1448309 RepID=A0A9P6B423_9AGAM|nr:hypothetical protein BS47DRAFT_1483908 [Hydnum rufescens UP504]
MAVRAKDIRGINEEAGSDKRLARMLVAGRSLGYHLEKNRSPAVAGQTVQAGFEHPGDLLQPPMARAFSQYFNMFSVPHIASFTFMIMQAVGAFGRPSSPPQPDPVNPRSGGSTNSTAFIAAGVSVGVAAIVLTYFIYKRSRKGRTPIAATRAGGASQVILATAEANLSAATRSTAPANSSNTRREARRSRRTRRTPSQISTKSLPAYKEEPGDQELVLVRRAMDPQVEESEEIDRSTTDASHTSDNYSPYPPSSTQLDDSLLPTDGEGASGDMDAVSPHRPNRATSMSIGSVGYSSTDSHGSMGSDTGLLPGTTQAPEAGADEIIQTEVLEDDVRGEAPPYFEYQDPRADSEPASHANPLSDEPTPSTETSTSRNRLSMTMPRPLRALFSGSLRNRPANAPLTPSPLSPLPESMATRERSDSLSTVADRGSSRSLLLSRSRSPSHARLPSFGTALNRPLTNNSSHSSLVHNRTRSGGSLGLYDAVAGAESSTSINSIAISSPLAHTVTRTAISFPKAGPTPEQLKFLSSRESLGRFGVPFGVDAEAAARKARSNPPPAFPSEGEASSSASGPSNSSPPVIRVVPASWWQPLTSPASGSTSLSTTPLSGQLELSPVPKSDEEEERSSPTALPIVADTGSFTPPTSASHPQNEPPQQAAASSTVDPPPPPAPRRGTVSSSLSLTIPDDGNDPGDPGLAGPAVNVIPPTPLTAVETH